MYRAIALLGVVLIVGVGIFLTKGVASAEPKDYDSDGDGLISKSEAVQAFTDYFADHITKDKVLEVIKRYFASPQPEEDVTAPELVEVTLDRSEIDVSQTARQIIVYARVKDDQAGVPYVSLTFSGPVAPHEVSTTMYVLASGTPTDGVYVGTITLPRLSKSGTWRLDSVQLEDKAGNHILYSLGELVNLGLSPSFEVMSPKDDLTPPELLEISVKSPEVDVSAGAQEITVTIRATDNLELGDIARVDFKSPSGEQRILLLALEPSERILTVREYVAKKLLPQHSESGTWRTSFTQLRDRAGNYRDYLPEELTQRGLSVSFEVVSSNQDVTPPELLDVSVEPSMIDVTGGDVRITATAQAIDDVSGIDYIMMDFWSPSANQDATVFVRPSPQVGTAMDRAYLKGTTTLSRYSESGTWRLGSVQIRDKVGNERLYPLEEFKRLELYHTFEVTSIEGDSNYPELYGLTLSHSEVYLDEGDAFITVGVRATDDSSGIDYVEVSFLGPAKQWIRSVLTGPITGTSTDGEFVGTIFVPQHLPSGIWRILLSLVDKAGNGLNYSGENLVELGLPESFEILK